MPRAKRYKNYTEIKKEVLFDKIKTAIWTCEALHFTDDNIMQYINGGLLGFKMDKKGVVIKDKNNAPIPITISRATFYKYKKIIGELPEIFQDLKQASHEGFARMLVGVQNLLDSMLKMSGENLFAEDLTATEKQRIIDSIVTKVLPSKTATASMIKKLMERGKIPKPEETNANTSSN